MWDNVNGAASLWTVAADGTRTIGPTYGPYSGWTARAVSEGPDGLDHLLWTNTNGTAVVWNVAAKGSFTQHSYGPYPGWKCRVSVHIPEWRVPPALEQDRRHGQPVEPRYRGWRLHAEQLRPLSRLDG